MNVFEFKSLLTFCLTNKLILITLQATQQNKREMFEFRNLRLKTNPYVDIKKYNNKRRFILNYDYKDWEKKTPDLYDDIFSKSKVFSTTTTSTISTTSSLALSPTFTTRSTSETTASIPTTIKDTTPSTIPTVIETTTTVSSSIENTPTNNTLEDVTSVTTPKLVETSSTEATLESKSFETFPISSNATTLITPEGTATSVLSPGTSITTSVQETPTVLTTSSSITTSTTTTTMSPQTTTAEIATTLSPFVTEIKNVKNKLRSGYFSASLVVVLRAIADKEPAQLLALMVGFHGVMMSMLSNHEFAFLGSPVEVMFTMVNDLMIQQFPEMVQGVAKEAALRLEDRRRNFEPDTNAIMDVVDTIYVDEDAANIAAVLDHLKHFPATDKSAEQISREGLQALVITPWHRVAGDPRQRLLKMELDAAIQHRAPGRPGRRHGVTSKKNYSKEILRTSNTTSATTESTYEYQYVKNATIMKRLKKRMSSYLVKMRSIRFSEWKVETRRGPTTTTTTTTIKPKMRKSKYYRMKKVMKNLRRRKNVTTTTTKFKWRYYGKVKKLKDVPYRKFEYYNMLKDNIQRKRENSCESKNHNITHSTQCSSVEKTDFDRIIDSDIDSYYSETDSSYEENNTTVESNSPETLTRLGKSGESYKSDSDSKMGDYEKYTQRNYKHNDERKDVKIYHQNNWKEIENYAKKQGFETKVNRYTEYSKRNSVNNKNRNYESDLKTKELNTNKYSFRNTYLKRNRNRYLSKTITSTRLTQIRIPINVKNYKTFTKSHLNRYNKNNIKRINYTKNKVKIETYNKIKLNDVIWHYLKKIMNNSVVTNDKYNDMNYRNNRFNTMKLHKSKKVHRLGKNTKISPKYQTVVSSDSIDDESLLKANLEDAMFHREDFRGKMKNRRNLEVKVNKLQQIDSISDDEVKIKGRIYKVLGFNENFGKQLRTIHSLHYFT